YGAIVSPDGFIITKDSQLPRKGKIVCRFADGNESEAQVVERSSPQDLVLLRVADRNLTSIQWSDNTLPSRGNWVATTNTQSSPIAVGVVSAGLMSVGPKKAVLGVVLREDNGAVIQKVYSGTGADVAGLQIGDRIRAIDGKKLANQDSAMDVLRTCQPGQSVQLTIQRGESELETHVQMMDLSDDLRDETEMEVNGSISARSSGFSTIFLHDTVLLPNQCGGPLVDLNGRVVGINIARAGRVSSYALPTSVVRPEVERMLAKANGSSISPANPIGPVIPAGAIITSGR
ncbi:MAG: PDZ domain-containing protein, partial [Pirellulaceae bacterium]|nr:PDZ domain-containing protein [Pirellulaceae bacterium]